MIRLSLPALLLLFSLPAYSATHLCIAETELYSAKWLVDEKGLRYFGKDEILLGDCRLDDTGTPRTCKYAGGGWGGQFFLHQNEVFTSFSFGAPQTDGTMTAYVVKGKCSAVSD